MPDSKPHLSFDFAFKKSAGGEPLDEDAPMRLVIIGNFSGRVDADGNSAAQVDVDNFETVVPKFAPRAETALGPVSISSMEDFHPDRLIEKIPSLAQLAGLRSRLMDPRRAEAAAAEAGALLGDAAQAPPAVAPQPETSGAQESAGDLIARLLGKAPASPASGTAPATGVQGVVEQLLKQAVGSTATPAPVAGHAGYLSAVEAELNKQLRAVLNDPSFKSLEATWRGLDLVVRETPEAVKLYVLDVSREELDRQTTAFDNPLASMIGRRLEAIGPVAVIAAFTFGTGDLDLLGRLGKLCAVAGTVIIGGGDSALVGTPSFGTTPNPVDWADAGTLAAFAKLRGAPESSRIGLVAPRFLARQPYGKGSDAIDAFPFEELAPGFSHEAYLWAPSSYLCALFLVNAFANESWDMDFSGTGGEISGLPIHTYKADGEKQTTPCAEALLSEKAGMAIQSRGLNPVLSMRGRDSVLLVSLTSIAIPPKPLAFRVG